LILTKPIGTGIIATAGRVDEEESAEFIAEAVRWMTTLNDVPSKLSDDLCRAVRSATDVTGFGLAGHILDMLGEHSQGGPLNLRMSLRSVPLLPGALDLANMGFVPEGAHRNREAYDSRVKIGKEYSPAEIDVLFDAQTSGGLLLAAPPSHAGKILEACRAAGFIHAAVIGEFAPGEEIIEAL
jgi:selenide,water dikinase